MIYAQIEQPCEPFRLNAAAWWAEVERLENQLEALYEMAPSEWINRTWAQCSVCQHIKRMMLGHSHCWECRSGECQACEHMEQLAKEAENDECPF